MGVRRRTGSRVGYVDIDSNDYDIYRTKDGIHLVFKLKQPFFYKFERIRVGEKIDRSRARVASPAPYLAHCNCPGGVHKDKRYDGKLELYVTETK